MTKSKAQTQRENKQDDRDTEAIRDRYQPELTRCAGGRLIPEDGNICIHCRSQKPAQHCKRPMSEASKPHKPDPNFTI